MAVDAVYLAMDFIKPFEAGPNSGFAANPYRCPAGKQTVGWGHVVRSEENIDMPLTPLRAEALLKADAVRAWRAIRSLVKVPLTTSMMAALISFVFNLGEGAFAESTLLKKLNARDYQGAADQILEWNKARNPKTGKLRALPGLTRRRRAERDMFLSDGALT